MLEKRGVLENTLVVVTSDNGCRFRTKGRPMTANHLPLAVMEEGRAPARSSRATT